MGCSLATELIANTNPKAIFLNVTLAGPLTVSKTIPSSICRAVIADNGTGHLTSSPPIHVKPCVGCVRQRALMTGAYRPDTRYAGENVRHLEVALKVPVVLYSFMNIVSASRRCWLAPVLLSLCSQLVAQGAAPPPSVLPGEPLISTSSPVGNSGNLIGVNLTPDVFGIADLLAPGDSEAGSFSTNCNGIACSDNILKIVELPGLSLEGERPSNRACVDTDNDGICDENDYCLGTPAAAVVLANGCGLSLGTPIVLSGVKFTPNSAALSATARAYLDEVAALIRTLPSPLLIIDGHTDAQGSEAGNLILSLRRAQSVFNYLIRSGVAKDALAYRGFGEGYPLIPSHTADGQFIAAAARINRRIELRLTDQREFGQVRAEMDAREHASRLVEERAAQLRTQKELQQSKEKDKVEAAAQGYSDVLEFLEKTGSAQTPAQQNVEEPTDPSASTDEDSEPSYLLELVSPRS